MKEPLISICIPAYRKPEFVVRCLESVLKQDYKKVEVIISDDSPDEDIKHATSRFNGLLDLHYFHNKPALRSPRNWNAALNKGGGEFLMLMHQDDWFHSSKALSTFVSAMIMHKADFVFCRNTAIDTSGNKIILQAIPRLLKEMAEKPDQLLLAQVIGPPSNTMVRKSVSVQYDEKFIWLVDVDYYSRMLKQGYKYHYIDEHLVSIGLHEDQTTVYCRTNNDIILRENIWFANKIGAQAFKDILIYDYYWRLLRNNGIRGAEDFIRNGIPANDVPEVIMHMLRLQSKLPEGLLKFGPLSKSVMLVNYLSWKPKSN